MSTESLRFHDPKTGRPLTANLKSARMIDGVMELTYSMPYDINGEVLPKQAALESGRAAGA